MALTKILNEFLKSQGYAASDITARYVDDEECYYYPSADVPYIVLGGLTNPVADKIFMRFCKDELGLKVDVDVLTLSFLHELGHHNTIDFLDDQEIEASQWTKFMLNIKVEEFSEKDYLDYFKCPIEIEATIDAVEFCNHCPEAVKKLDTAIQEAL